MVKKDFLSHLLVAGLYALVVTLLGRHFQPEFLLFWFGTMMGAVLLYFDPLVSAYLTSQTTPLYQEIKELVRQRKFGKLLVKELPSHHEEESSILHSALFQVTLTILAFYIVTSSGSLLASGLVMGMVLHLVRDEVEEWKETEKLKRQLFWNIHRPISDKELKIYLSVVLAAFGLEAILLL